MSNFIDMCRDGQARPGDIDNFIDRWHETPNGMPLYAYLGMTRKEYSMWVEDETVLASIIGARPNDLRRGNTEARHNAD